MNIKPQPREYRGKQNWGEIQLAIAAGALAATLMFWNLFSTPQQQQGPAQAADTTLPPADPTQVATATPGFIPVKIIFGGPAPKQQVIVQPAAAQPKRNSGGGSAAPQPAASTGSSKP